METDTRIIQLKKPKYCKYPFCGATNKRLTGKPCSLKRFFRFPKDAARLAFWKEVCNIHPNVKCTNFYICEDHFSPPDFNNLKFPKKLSSKAIPRKIPDTLPEQIREHDYAIFDNTILNHQSDKKTPEKHKQLRIDLKLASLEQKMNLLNSVCINQKNFLCPGTKPYSKQSFETNSDTLRRNGSSDYCQQAEQKDSIDILTGKFEEDDSTSILRRILDDSVINQPETNEEPFPFKINSVYSSIYVDKEKTYCKNIMPYYYLNDWTQLNMNAIPKSPSRSKLHDEHNYAHQKPCQPMDHDYC